MRDRIDKAFERDLEKLGKAVPSELALNAAKIKAAQDPSKKGAEKPDLYARGKGRGKGGRFVEDEENDKLKSKGPDRGEKKDSEDLKKDKEQGLKTTGVKMRSIEKEHERQAEKCKKKATSGLLAKVKALNKMHTEQGAKRTKKASLDKQFTRDLSQIVGIDVPEADPDFERPQVKIAGQVEDAIDVHYLSWMKERADEDVVKLAGKTRDIVRKVRGGTYSEAEKLLKSKLRGAAAKGAVGAAGVTVPVTAAVMRFKERREKTAGIIENPENLDLLSRIRRAAAAKTGVPIHGCSDA